MHNINASLLSSAIEANGSIEIDVSVNEYGELFIGHPTSFYSYKGLKLPDNLDINYVIEVIESTKLIVVFDCKDIRALEWIEKTVKRLGPNRVMVHAWIDNLLFKPYEASIVEEPHWIHEDLPLSVLKDLYITTGVPLLFSSRGLSNTYINKHYMEVIDKITDAVKNIDAAVNLNLPASDMPALELINDLLNRNILTLQNVDSVSPEMLPATYIGMTDDIKKQSITSEKV